MKKQKNIDSICFHAAFWPALGLVALSIVIAVTLFTFHLDSIIEREHHRHELISELFIKSGNADIIIGNEHALYVMLKEYQEKYHLNGIRIGNQQDLANRDSLYWSNQINSAWPIPGVAPTQYVIIESKIKYKDIITSLISSFGIIGLFVIASILMFKRIKRKLNEQIIVPLSQTLKCEGNDLEWFNQEKAATEISELYQRTHQFIKTLHEQRDAIEEHNIKQAKYDVALQMAHDIRSPVLALKTLSQIIVELNEDNKKMMTNITQRISQIADDLLREHGPTSIRNIENHPHDCSSIGSVIEAIFHEKNALCNKIIEFNLLIDELSYRTRSNIPDQCLTRLLSNLIDNSIQAIKHSGTIELIVKSDINNIKITLEDTGCGISPSNLGLVFKYGFSANKKKGNGLGLTYAKKTIEKHQGTINIVSNKGERTIVSISIPSSPHE